MSCPIASADWMRSLCRGDGISLTHRFSHFRFPPVAVNQSDEYYEYGEPDQDGDDRPRCPRLRVSLFILLLDFSLFDPLRRGAQLPRQRTQTVFLARTREPLCTAFQADRLNDCFRPRRNTRGSSEEVFG